MPYSTGNDPQAGLGSSALGTLESATSEEVATGLLSDTVDLTTYAKGFYCGAAGVVVYLPTKNADVNTITKTVVAGSYHPVQVRRILSTGTTVPAAAITLLRGT